MAQYEEEQRSWSRRLTAIAGGVLLVAAIIGLGYLIFGHQSGPSLSFPTLPSTSATPTSGVASSSAPLTNAGITLGHPSQSPSLKQQQALAIANQLEPDAASGAKQVSEQYVSLTYNGTNTPTTQATINNVPVWLVLYQGIPLPPADASVDLTPYPHSHHDLYVFLDASTGKELLAIWV